MNPITAWEVIAHSDEWATQLGKNMIDIATQTILAACSKHLRDIVYLYALAHGKKKGLAVTQRIEAQCTSNGPIREAFAELAATRQLLLRTKKSGEVDVAESDEEEDIRTLFKCHCGRTFPAPLIPELSEVEDLVDYIDYYHQAAPRWANSSNEDPTGAALRALDRVWRPADRAYSRLLRNSACMWRVACNVEHNAPMVEEPMCYKASCAACTRFTLRGVEKVENKLCTLVKAEMIPICGDCQFSVRCHGCQIKIGTGLSFTCSVQGCLVTCCTQCTRFRLKSQPGGTIFSLPTCTFHLTAEYHIFDRAHVNTNEGYQGELINGLDKIWDVGNGAAKAMHAAFRQHASALYWDVYGPILSNHRAVPHQLSSYWRALDSDWAPEFPRGQPMFHNQLTDG